nr:MAG TPA: glycoprotein [Caudoviricetes sp.]
MSVIPSFCLKKNKTSYILDGVLVLHLCILSITPDLTGSFKY